MQGLLRKNYKQHLKTKHPKENHDDMTPFGQSKITELWKKKETVPVKRAEPDPEHVDAFSDEEIAIESDSEKKRRHVSGDSGVGEDAACFEPKRSRVVLHDRPGEVTNKDLNDKLDKILKCVEKDETNYKSAEGRVVKEDAKNLNVIKYARSLDEILGVGFVYDLESATVTCNVCEDKSG